MTKTPSIDDRGWYLRFAAAFVRGRLGGLDEEADSAVVAAGREAGLRVHRFKRNAELPRVRAALGALRGLAPDDVLDVGSGRGTFLWPLLDAFPAMPVTTLERDAGRARDLGAVRRGGVAQLRGVRGDAARLPFRDDSFDVVTLLEVLEHQDAPRPLAAEALRVARRCVIASVPSHPDDNPEHVQLFDRAALEELFTREGATRVRIDGVPRHWIAVVRAS